MKKILLATLVGGTMALTGCASTGSQPMQQSSSDSSEDTSAAEADEVVVDEEEEPPAQTVTKANIDLQVRETSKQCYGAGVGCNLEFKVVPSLVGLNVDDGFAEDYDITYEVRGGQEGPLMETFVLYTDGTYDVPYENMVGTASSATKLKAVVTSVTPTNY